VASSETLFGHLSGGARKINKATDKIVFVPVEIRTQQISNINHKLSPLEPACSVLCCCSSDWYYNVSSVHSAARDLEWSVLWSVQKLTFTLPVSLTLPKRHLTALQNKSNTVCIVNCEGTV